MQGYGLYKYADDVRYDGQFAADKKQGYGIYKWTDGRKYEGWWYKGKQHGIGTYYSNKKNQTVKFGLWEHGKRVKWFENAELDEARAGMATDTLAELFSDPASAGYVPSGSNFDKPSSWDEKIATIRENMDVPFE